MARQFVNPSSRPSSKTLGSVPWRRASLSTRFIASPTPLITASTTWSLFMIPSSTPPWFPACGQVPHSRSSLVGRHRLPRAAAAEPRLQDHTVPFPTGGSDALHHDEGSTPVRETGPHGGAQRDPVWLDGEPRRPDAAPRDIRRADSRRYPNGHPAPCQSEFRDRPAIAALIEEPAYGDVDEEADPKAGAH